MHTSPTAHSHSSSSLSSYSPLTRPTPPPHASPGHHSKLHPLHHTANPHHPLHPLPHSHHHHHASLAHLPSNSSPSPTGHHHPHALSLSTLPSYLSPTFQPSHPKPSPTHRPPPAHDPTKEFYGPSATVQRPPLQPWRLTSRSRTLAVSVLLCLNAGIDPPDSDHSSSSSLLAYYDVLSTPPPQSLRAVLERLQAQYERWQPKARYRLIGDPCPSELKKALQAQRKAIKAERMLLHYAGYGVPRFSDAGELWVFNKGYTQYLPVPLRDVVAWAGWPVVLVVDSAAAGNAVEAVRRWVDEPTRGAGAGDARPGKEEERKEADGDGGAPATTGFNILSSISTPASPTASANPPGKAFSPPPPHPTSHDIIVLAACAAHQSPPLHPSLPADLFTCCLTTPLTISLRHFALHSPLLSVSPAHVDLIPGSAADRKTPLGELTWIFTAITDSIAYSSFDTATFSRLFRQDLLVASLYRNFLLAQRVMRAYGVTPISYPALPSTHKHGLWDAWDAVQESYLLNLERYLKGAAKFPHPTFFADHLAAFESSLELLSASSSPPPVQLPVVLQVLLSPGHRRKALVLLARYMGKGSWCVQHALGVGIFPYMLKLLESNVAELREVLCFIWSRIVALDGSTAQELMDGGGFRFFLDGLQPATPNVSDRQRATCLVVLALVTHHSPSAQTTLATTQLLSALSSHLDSDSAVVRRWSLLLLAKLVHGNHGVSSSIPSLSDRAALLCFDPQSEVRAAAVYAISAMVDDSAKELPSSSSFSSTTSSSSPSATTPPASPLDDEHPTHTLHLLSLFRLLVHLCYDGSAQVREELAIALGVLIDASITDFHEVVREEERDRDGDRTRDKKDDALNPLPPLAPLTPTPSATVGLRSSPSPLISPVNTARKVPHIHSQRGSSASPHSSSPSPSPPPSSLPSFQSSLSLPLSRAFSEPPQNMAAGRPSPPSLVLGSSGLSSGSLSSLPDSSRPETSRPPSPATTALSSMTTSSSTASLHSVAPSNPYMTPPRSLRLSAAARDGASPHTQRQTVWRCVRLLCQDAMPSVATAAVSVYRRAVLGERGPQQKKESPIFPGAIGDGVMIMQTGADVAGGSPSPRSALPAPVPEGRQSPAKTMDTSDLRDDGERRSHVTLNPLRRIASAASNMAHHHSYSLFSIPSSSSASSLLSRDADGAHSAERPPSSSQSSPTQSASSSPHTASFAPSSNALSMLSLLSAPASSSIFDRSVDAFLTPAVELPTASPEATLLTLMQREYRQRQVEQMQRAEVATPHPTTQSLDAYCTLPTGLDSVGGLLWHPYQPLLAACDSRRTVVLMDWERKERRCLWSHENRAGTRVSSMAWVNPTAVSLLATATDSGEVRVWRNPHHRQPALVAAWMGMKGGGGAASRQRGGAVSMCMEWMQAQGWMLCAGASDVVSVWDVEREMCVMDAPVDDAGVAVSGAWVTSLAASSTAPLFFTGGSDGALRCFDLRSSSTSSFVIAKQQSPVVRVHFSRHGDGADDGSVTCASRDGDVLRADLRFIVNREDRGMTTLTLSPAHMPVQGRTGSSSPSAASTAGSVSSHSGSSLHPSPMLFPSNPSPLSTASSPPMLPHSSSSSPVPSSSSPALASASPLHHLTAFPSGTQSASVVAFAAHPAFALYAAVSAGRQLRAFSDSATLLSVKEHTRLAGGAGGLSASKLSPVHRRQVRSISNQAGRPCSADAVDVVSWHPTLLMLAACIGGGGTSLCTVPRELVGGGAGAGASSVAAMKESSTRGSGVGLFSSSFIP